ncbi:MAG: hypothetical protein ACK4M9_19625 [Anaerobacillus sp.]|uniref:hypothetical protein n=1 Tax=Anaerobacillus sp. TaxID=1872506 RepID=UPI00391D1876
MYLFKRGLIIFFVLLAGCNSSSTKIDLNEGDVKKFIYENNLTVDLFSKEGDYYYIFYDNSSESGIIVLRGKDSEGKFEYGHSKGFSKSEVSLGSGESGYVGLIVRDETLLKDCSYITIVKGDQEENIAFDENQKYQVLKSDLISRTYDYTLNFYDNNHNLLYSY